MSHSDNGQHQAKQECFNLIQEQHGVTAVVIASLDGFDFASASSKSIEVSRIAAMASSIAAIGSVVTQEVALGNHKSVTVNTENGFIYVTYVELCGITYTLIAVADAAAILARVIYACNDIAKRLKAV